MQFTVYAVKIVAGTIAILSVLATILSAPGERIYLVQAAFFGWIWYMAWRHGDRWIASHEADDGEAPAAKEEKKDEHW
jgi:hypothetical protein